MGEVRPVQPVKLVVSLLTSLPRLEPEVERELTDRYGRVDLKSEAFPFDSTKYYNRQMGTPITRRFYAFADLISPASLSGIKRQTKEFEALVAEEHRETGRPINLDPGYLEESKLILASTKNFYHRIHIGEGIYAEVTMHWEERKWKTFPWTFPDFRTGHYDSFFTALRRVYRQQLAGISC